MGIQAGQRVGPYEILAAVGAGGMGEVYRARDTRLDRTVAIKVLPSHLADKPELRERFEREARTIASLNHPHICTLHDVGHQDGIDYLVLEYLEGETLAERLKKGPLPLNQVLPYAIEISDALDKAHRKGITHRDLKPGNILLTKSGAKLLDFGLAKLKQEAAPLGSLSQRPTAESAMTAEGTILGTLQYMAPEQVEGKTNEIDARTDIFAFGAVVYEMATGKKAFEGKTSASVMAKILEVDPPSMVSLQPMTPPPLERVVKTCLAKQADERWQTAIDLCRELKWIAEGGSQVAVAIPHLHKGNRQRRVVLAAAVAFAIAIISALTLYLRRAPQGARQVTRFTVGPPEKGSFYPAPMFLTISPDGSKLAFVGADASRKEQLWVRALDSPTARPLPGTDNPSQPFWSADSRFLAFTAEGKLKKIAVSGGPALTLTDAPGSGGGAWNGDDVILFSSEAVIYRVPLPGGEAIPLTMLDASRQEVAHRFPYFLPDGKHFLYLAFSAKRENSAIFVGSLESKEKKLLLNATSNPVYVPPGYLLFNREGTLMAQSFDAGRLQLKGDAVPVAEGLLFNPASGRSAFGASNNGLLAYRLGAEANLVKLVWVTRNGLEQPLAAPPHGYSFFRLSPDGRRVAITITEQETQIWLYDLARQTLSPFTFGDAVNRVPEWTPDGKRIVFNSAREGAQKLYWQQADGSGGLEKLTTGEDTDITGSFSSDGQLLAFFQLNSITGYDISILRLSDRKVQPFLHTQFNEAAPAFSPDGRWLAYISDESGRSEVYVQPYPGPGGKYPISTEGGTEPRWNPNGRELFYRSGDKMMAVDITTKPGVSVGKPKMLFQGPYVPTILRMPYYDVSPDGQRFLMLKPSEQISSSSLPQIVVVENWLEELRQKVPTGKK